MEMFNNNTTEDHDTTTKDIVELATLILPSHAADGGMEAGDGDEVVLEALQETVDNITAHCQISAVVDLEILSELMGISEEEFIADLHMDATEHRQFDEENDEEHGTWSIIGGNTATGTSGALEPTQTQSEAEAKAGEEQPLLGHSSIDQPTTQPTSDRVTLTADPFIETLADVLPTIGEGQRYNGSEISSVGGVIADFTMEDADTHHEAAATKTDGDHLGHDAFLLNIPNENSTTGDMQDHFVLALPEIRLEASVAASSISHASMGDYMHIPLMERAMSMALPSDVVQVQLEAKTHTPTKADPTELHLDLVVQRQVPIIGYVILISGLVALASVGAALDLQHGPSPTMKTLWRQLATCAALSPLVVKSLYCDGFPQLTRSQWLTLPLCGMAYAYMCVAFVGALGMTTLANAFVLSNMTSLVIIVGRFVLGLPILRSEGLGAVLGFTGAAICANDASKTLALLVDDDIDSTSYHSSNAMMGNLLALSASFGTAVYLIFAKRLRSSLDIFVFMFSVMFLGSVFLIISMAIFGEDYTFGMDPDIGIFGWLHLTFDRLPLEIFMAVVCNCLGTTGYIAVMKYFEPIVPASVMLMEPVVGTLLGALAGTAALPGRQTWLGDAVVAAGTFLVIWSGAKKTEKIEATEALRPSSGDDTSTVATLIQSPLPRKPGPSQRKADEATPARVVWDS